MDLSEASITSMITAIAALGTASYGLVDTSKAFRGGISNVGFRFIEQALEPFRTPLTAALGGNDPLAQAKANWLNGMDKDQQKTAVKNMIRLGITAGTAADLVKNIPSIDGATFTGIAKLLDNGTAPDEAGATLLGRFDAIVDARLDAAFERADQQYRNSARVVAALVAIVLAELGAVNVYGASDPGAYAIGLVVGLVAVPLAPIAKDLTSALSTAVNTFKSIRR